jgi:hypothetical protein
LPQPTVVVQSKSLEQAALYQSLLDAEARGQAKRAERKRIKAIAKSPDASAFCGRCGRPWQKHFVTRAKLMRWSLAMLSVGWIVGALMIFTGIVRLG